MFALNITPIHIANKFRPINYVINHQRRVLKKLERLCGDVFSSIAITAEGTSEGEYVVVESP